MPVNSDFVSYVAEAAVPRYRIVKPGAAGGVVLATAATDKLLGTAGNEPGASTGEVVDLAVGPLPKVVLGGTVAQGDLLTSDANGKAIATTTAGNHVIGRAYTAGVADDEISYLRGLCRI